MKRLDQLRQKLESLKLDGFVVPRADEYQGEYVPANAERLAWLTGFTGSAGYAVVLADKAAVFADGRYTIQAKAEVDQNEFALLHLIEEPPTQYLSKNIKTGQRIGYDPWVFTPVMVDRFKEVCAKKGAEFVPVASSPLV
jgi:Xaa-Pro aminopeptidase